MPIRRLAPATALLTVLLPVVLAAQQRPAALDPSTRRAVVTEVVDALRRAYVSADTADIVAAHLQRRLDAGAYDSLLDPHRFAEVVTTDLRAVNGDEHLALFFDPEDARRAPRLARDTAVPAGGGVMPPLGGASAAQPPSVPAEVAAAARRANYGLTRVEILPGNVGYLEVAGFRGADGVEQAIAHALETLAHTDAIIIDLRRNGGGSGRMSHLLFSHFLGAEPVPTIRVVDRVARTDETLRSVGQVSGPRRPDVPLYVLTSRASASAAEEFAFVLRNLGRATIVGDRTAGAGHMNMVVGVDRDFTVSISFRRVSDARTGAEWERVGVAPHLAVPVEEALDAAHAAALRALAAKQGDGTTAWRRLQWLAEAADARRAGRRPASDDLRRIVGLYGDVHRVLARDGRLWLQRGEGTVPFELLPLPDGRYAMAESRLRVDGARLTIERPDGAVLEYARHAD